MTSFAIVLAIHIMIAIDSNWKFASLAGEVIRMIDLQKCHNGKIQRTRVLLPYQKL